MTKIWIISDQHLNHVNICGPSLTNWDEGFRNFSSLKEMEDCIVDNTNALVQPQDTIYDLGDIFMGQVKLNAAGIMSRFKCKNRHLIYGNHDKAIKKDRDLQSLFSSCQNYFELRWKNKLIVMFHYPISSWNEMGKGSIHCYGHVHTSYKHYGRSHNACVELNDYKPVLLDDIIDICSSKPLDLVDHHSPETTY